MLSSSVRMTRTLPPRAREGCVKYGISIAHSIERISITRVNEWESEILGVEEGEPAFYERGQEWTEQMEPVEYFKSVTLPAHFRFASDEVWDTGAAEVSDAWLRL